MSAARKYPSLADDRDIEIHTPTDELELSSSEDEDQARNPRRTPEAFKVTTAIPKAAVASHLDDPKFQKENLRRISLKQELHRALQRESCFQFIVVIVFMVGFLILMLTHEDILHVYTLENVVKKTLTKPYGEHSLNFKEVQDVVEIWKWMDYGLLPAIVRHTDPIGHKLPHEQWGYIAEYNRVIGGLRIAQHRSDTRHCHYDELDEFYGDCQPLDTIDNEDFGYPDCDDPAAVAYYNSKYESVDDDELVRKCYNTSIYQGAVDLNNNEGFKYDPATGQFEMWIDLFDEEEIIYKRIDYLKDRHWIDKQTKDITFSLIVFNSQYEPFVAEALLKFDFSRAGSVKPSMKVETVTISPYFTKQAFKLTLEVLFIGVLLYLLHTECHEIYDRKKKLMNSAERAETHVSAWSRAVVEHFWSGHEPLGNAVDLATIGLGVALCAMWLEVVFAMAKAEHSLKHLHRPEGDVAYDDTDHDVWSVYHHEVAYTEMHIADVLYKMTTMRRLSFFMVLLMIFLMFKTWDGIPAMQGVSATVLNASSRLFSFGIILMCLLTLFAGAAMLGFGQQMEEFHTFSNSFLTTLIVMTTGSEEIYENQLEIDQLLASIWHWLLVCIMYVVCLNLLLCILVDAYGESRAQLAETVKDMVVPTLYEQGVDTALFYSKSFRNRFTNIFNAERSSPKPTSVAPSQAAQPNLKKKFSSQMSSEFL